MEMEGSKFAIKSVPRRFEVILRGIQKILHITFYFHFTLGSMNREIWFLLQCFLVFICVCMLVFKICLFEKESDREREIFYPLVHFWLNNGQVWTMLKPGSTSSSILGSHVAVKGPVTWAIFHCLPKQINRKINQKGNSQDLNQHSEYGMLATVYLAALQHRPQ